MWLPRYVPPLTLRQRGRVTITLGRGALAGADHVKTLPFFLMPRFPTKQVSIGAMIYGGDTFKGIASNTEIAPSRLSEHNTSLSPAELVRQRCALRSLRADGVCLSFCRIWMTKRSKPPDAQPQAATRTPSLASVRPLCPSPRAPLITRAMRKSGNFRARWAQSGANATAAAAAVASGGLREGGREG